MLAQQEELLVSGLNQDDLFPIHPALPGERHRIMVGGAMAAGRAIQLIEVQIQSLSRVERSYERVELEMGVRLKLVSRDWEWSFEYGRFKRSPQSIYYFEEPPRYKKRMSTTGVRGEGVGRP